MKIIISNYDDLNNPYYGGGGAVAIHEVSKRLTSKMDVTVITGKYPKSKDEAIDRVHYKRIGLSYAGPKIGQLIYQFFLPYYAWRSDFDIWIENFTPPFSTAFLSIFTKKPVIGLVHLLAGSDKSRQYKLPFYLVENKGLTIYKYFIVLTESILKKIKKKNFSALVKVIPNGISGSILNKKINRKRSHILYIGRIEVDQKGIDFLLDAYKLASNKINKELIIAGSGIKKEEVYLKEKIKKLQLQDKVKFIGRVEGKKKDELFKNSSFLVMPSRYETFPLVVLEAFAYGSPLLSFDIEGFKWVPQSCSVKVKPFDVSKLADAMVKLSVDKSLNESMGKTSREFVKRYSWDTISLQYEDFINSVVSRRDAL